MPTVIECDPDSPALDVPESVDIAQEPFFADLERLYRRASVLPAALGRMVGTQVKVLQRAEYIAWARMLGRRARVVLLDISPQGIEQVAQGLRVIDSQEARQEEEVMLSKPSWQIYRFVKALPAPERTEFSQAVTSAMSISGRAKVCSPIEFFDENRAAEFQAFIPPFDDSSRRALLASLLRFSQEVTQIVAFNGHRFMPLKDSNGSS
jgi:hypothetical protein